MNGTVSGADSDWKWVLQGAIDLVQLEQQREDPVSAHRQLKQYRQYYHPPRRIANQACPDSKSLFISDVLRKIRQCDIYVVVVVVIGVFYAFISFFFSKL